MLQNLASFEAAVSDPKAEAVYLVLKILTFVSNFGSGNFVVTCRFFKCEAWCTGYSLLTKGLNCFIPRIACNAPLTVNSYLWFTHCCVEIHSLSLISELGIFL